MAGLDYFRRVHKIFRDASAFEEARLIQVDKRKDMGLEPSRQDFLCNFYRTVLERYGSKMFRLGDPWLFWD